MDSVTRVTLSLIKHKMATAPATVSAAKRSSTFAYGFDPEASLPNARLFLTVLRSLDNAALQFLLDSTVELIRRDLPPNLNFGQTVAIDTKHILAWVKENNPQTFIKEGRYDKTRQPAADAASTDRSVLSYRPQKMGQRGLA